jgi:hypothetical protein
MVSPGESSIRQRHRVSAEAGQIAHRRWPNPPSVCFRPARERFGDDPRQLRLDSELLNVVFTFTPSVGFRLAAAIQSNTISFVGLWKGFKQMRPFTRTFAIITKNANAMMTEAEGLAGQQAVNSPRNNGAELPERVG